MTRPAVVACGGGHGLAATLHALRHVTERVTAIVTVADDGGSSGRLRGEYGVLPPGDLRMALAALCEDTEWGQLWAGVLQHRFAGDGPLGGHAVGNLLLVGLWDLLGDTERGLDVVRHLLGARGRVLPMASVPLDIAAMVRDPQTGEVGEVTGQAQVAVVPGEVLSVRLLPENPPASPEAVRAVDDADWVILGPGSWYTSVMPHLLVPELREALCSTRARRILTLNLELDKGETAGYSAERHLATLSRYAPDLQLDVVLVDPSVVGDEDALRTSAGVLGADLVVAEVSSADGTATHDALRLAAAYRDIFG